MDSSARTLPQRIQGEANSWEKWSTLSNQLFIQGHTSFRVPEFDLFGGRALSTSAYLLISYYFVLLSYFITVAVESSKYHADVFSCHSTHRRIMVLASPSLHWWILPMPAPSLSRLDLNLPTLFQCRQYN